MSIGRGLNDVRGGVRLWNLWMGKFDLEGVLVLGFGMFLCGVWK